MLIRWQSDCWKSHHVAHYKAQFDIYYATHYAQKKVLIIVVEIDNEQNDEILTRLLIKFRKQKSINVSFDSSSKQYDSKVHSYFSSSLVIITKQTLNIVKYWKKQATQYSHLANMTKNVLATFCFEMSVEQLFNLARNVITYRKKRLNLMIIETIIILKYNLNIDCIDTFFEQNVDEFFTNKLFSNVFDIFLVIIFESSNDDDNESLD
jgi:transcription termination factor NusB